MNVFFIGDISIAIIL